MYFINTFYKYIINISFIHWWMSEHFLVTTWNLTSHPQFQPSKKKVATSNDSSFRSPPLVLGVGTSNHRAASRSKDAAPTRIESRWERFHLYRDNITPRCYSYILNSIAFDSRCTFSSKILPVPSIANPLLSRPLRSLPAGILFRPLRPPGDDPSLIEYASAISTAPRTVTEFLARGDVGSPSLAAATSSVRQQRRPRFLFLPSRGETRRGEARRPPAAPAQFLLARSRAAARRPFDARRTT